MVGSTSSRGLMSAAGGVVLSGTLPSLVWPGGRGAKTRVRTDSPSALGREAWARKCRADPSRYPFLDPANRLDDPHRQQRYPHGPFSRISYSFVLPQSSFTRNVPFCWLQAPAEINPAQTQTMQPEPITFRHSLPVEGWGVFTPSSGIRLAVMGADCTHFWRKPGAASSVTRSSTALSTEALLDSLPKAL
jgi:hypothetical protein